MIVRAVDSEGNFVFGKGASSYKKDLPALKQTIECKIKEWKGNCWFDVDAGIDWQTRLSKNLNSLQFLKIDIIGIIQSIPEVLSVEFVGIVYQDRQASLSYSITSVYGGLSNEVINLS